MEITRSTIKKATPITFLHVHGSIDSSTVEALTESAITEAQRSEGQLILDLGGVTFIEGVALRLVVQLYRALHPEGGRGGRVAILNAPERLARLHKALGLGTMVPMVSGRLDDVLEATEVRQNPQPVSERLPTTNDTTPAWDLS